MDPIEIKKLYFLIQKIITTVYFTEYKYSDSYWDGIKIDFSGKNSSYCYALIQKQEFDWNIFRLPNLSLSRFDLYYFRERQHNDQQDPLRTICIDSLDKLNSNIQYKLIKKSNLIAHVNLLTPFIIRTS